MIPLDKEAMRDLLGVEAECQLHHTFGNVDVT